MSQLLEFAGNHPLLVAAAFGLLATIVVTEIRHRNRGFAELAPADAVRLINADALVLDVRSVEAYRKGHVVDARNVPLADLSAQAAKLERFKEGPVLAYCDNGIASQRAAAELRKLGFSEVATLRGGLEGWKRDNYPVQQG